MHCQVDVGSCVMVYSFFHGLSMTGPAFSDCDQLKLGGAYQTADTLYG